MFDLSDFEYELPEELIAQAPCPKRDGSRLMVVGERTRGQGETGVFFSDKRFSDIVDLLEPGSVIVFNNTEVFPARLRARRKTGGLIEVMLARRIPDPINQYPTEQGEEKGDCIGAVENRRWSETWLAMLKPARRLKRGEELELLDRKSRAVKSCKLETAGMNESGDMMIKLSSRGKRWADVLSLCRDIGETPLPPYIRRPAGERESDRMRYQTVYARVPGAVAAPTAGLHFTGDILDRITRKDVKQAHVTLHVGPGTFKPIKTDDPAKHVMHSEWYHLPRETAAVIEKTRKRGGSVVAVGTTTVRVLESCVDESGCLKPGTGETDLFIYPGFKFRTVDAMVTNFHLPRSSLLLLVAAFAGKETILNAYQHGVKERYRFYSYGDAMLLYRSRSADLLARSRSE